VLGLADVRFLDYLDGDVGQADPAELAARLVSQVRQVRPQVVVTFGPDGAYGHPDHIAISQLATTALLCAADPNFQDPEHRPAHRVVKLYYRVWSGPEMAAFEAAFGELTMTIDGVPRCPTAWQDWAITTRIDTERHWHTAWEAIACHRSQLPLYGLLQALPEERQRELWGSQGFYRALGTANRGRTLETDLFDGLRGQGASADHAAAAA
jgi:LmbE family N-acetylglucosaminyl deacetylase